MTERELGNLEERLGSPLPRAYRELLLNYPAELTEKNRLDYEDEDGNAVMYSTSDRELANSLESLIAMNFDDPENYEFSLRLDKWPEGFFIIGWNDFGGVYAIDLNNDDPAVYFADQSTSIFDPQTDGLEGYFEKEAMTVGEWARRLIAAHGTAPKA